MGVMNLVRSNWRGKVGELVGAKWKNLSTIRSYVKPAYTNTPAQDIIRTNFSVVTKYLALFCPLLKGLTSLDVRGQSIRNAVIQLNREMISPGPARVVNLRLSKGSLPIRTITNVQFGVTPNVVDVVFAGVPVGVYTSKARTICVVVNVTQQIAAMDYITGATSQMAIPLQMDTGDVINIHSYVLDYHGSLKVSSETVQDQGSA